MKILLQIKAWQLFLIWIILSILSLISYVAGFLLILIYLSWIYSIGVTMLSFIPQNVRPKLEYFKFSCIFLLAALVILSVNNAYGIVKLPWWLEASIIIYYLWSAFYTIMFAARMLESVIEGELVNRSDSLKTFLYMCFTPFGLWPIQKTVQRILADKDATKS